MVKLKPIRLVLDKPLTGPYDRLLRRPGPEVAELVRGTTIIIIRGVRLTAALPLWEAETACYYGKGNNRVGWSIDDFREQELAGNWHAKQVVEAVAVPYGSFKLPNASWVGPMAAELTPWNAGVIAEWQAGLARDIWLTVVRLYQFTPVQPQFLQQTGLHVRVKPFQLENLQPILTDEVFQQRVNQVQLTVERFTESSVSQSASAVRNTPPYDEAAFVAETGYEAGQLRKWSDQLQRKIQLILYGPPGTGKTYLAERLARYVATQGNGFSELVQFHASYAYEDFVQGIRPQIDSGQLHYELAEGRFLQFCRIAREMDPKLCVLVIDEINRANLARVFGELLYLLEYRDREIPLSGGGPPFSIPNNVYLIGTMNTADRSIAWVDQAMRRRFSFIRLQPDYQLLARHLKKCGMHNLDLVELVEEVNQSIGDADCLLGISFFLVVDLQDQLANIWQGEIEPYLEEAFFDRPEEMSRFRWSKVGKRLAG